MIALVPEMALNGLMLGLTLMLVALGLTLVFGIVRIVNLAHGEFYMLGGMVAWYFAVKVGLNYWLALVLAMVTVSLLGAVAERFGFRYFRSNLVPSVILSVGIIFVLDALVMLGLGTQAKALPGPFSGQVLLLGVSFSTERLMIMVISLGLVLATILFVQRTRAGAAMRGVAQDAEGAALQGVSIDWTARLTMMVGGALAGAGGALLGSVFQVEPAMGFPMVVKALIAITLGGMGSVSGVVLAALMMGMIESFATTLAGVEVAGMVLFALLALFLLVRPYGFFGYEYRV